jgi:NRAMP (natural resistance-associated macrophage protein)-like metal ion transporter
LDELPIDFLGVEALYQASHCDPHMDCSGRNSSGEVRVERDFQTYWCLQIDRRLRRRGGAPVGPRSDGRGGCRSRMIRLRLRGLAGTTRAQSFAEIVLPNRADRGPARSLAVRERTGHSGQARTLNLHADVLTKIVMLPLRARMSGIPRSKIARHESERHPRAIPRKAWMRDAPGGAKAVALELRSNQRVKRVRPAFWSLLGAGLVAGAAGNDPSGIATYSQAGAKFGFQLAWILLLTYPLIVVIQTVSARLGRATGRGIAGNLRERYPKWFVQSTVGLLLIANSLNIGADLQGMAEAVRLLIPHAPAWIWIVFFGALCSLGRVLFVHQRYVALLKVLALVPLSYLAVLLAVSVPWSQVVQGLFWPRWSMQSSSWLMVVAMLGTTISPYLFFWQSAQEVEDTKADPARAPLIHDSSQTRCAFTRIGVDTFVGMGLSNLVGLAILVTAAATLPQAGVHDVSTAAQAAQALRPAAGDLAFALFALGVVGSGLLCVQVLAGSAAYALAEALCWPVGLARESLPGRAVYPIVVIATLTGALASMASVSAIHALVWSGLINGVVAIPVMAALMLMARHRDLIGALRITRGWIFLGWFATAVMAIAAVGWAWTAL